MHGARGPPARGDLCHLERPQQNQQGAGDACETDSGKGRRRCGVGESHAMGDGGFRIPKLPHISDGDHWDERQRGVPFSSALLHKNRTNHPCHEQQAVRAAPRRAHPTRSVAANKARRVGLENKKKTSRIGEEKPSC